jgi:hypothetical protein
MLNITIIEKGFRALLCLLFMLTAQILWAQNDSTKKDIEFQVVKKDKTTNWYENISIRGYSQIRYNRILETNSNLTCEQCDRSWGKEGGVFIRRMRIILFGQINKQVYFYVQPDLASSPSSDRLHFAQIRDAYVDASIDRNNEFRFRIGQSKIPFGFENLQSSQNRLPIDRADALNSALPNERDMGAVFYWAPSEKRKLFAELVSSGLKGSGDYGVFAFGAYNGQTANSPELNNELHYVTRFSYPFKLKNQILEMGIQAYSGNFVITKSNLSSGVKSKSNLNYKDQRMAATFVLYPKPFGILAEYNIGEGPRYNKNKDSVELSNLYGGFITMSYFIKKGKHNIIPYTRFQYYNGGKKTERDARSYEVNETEIGIEWQPSKQLELQAAYTISSRRYEDFVLKNNLQIGNLLRLQVQYNF